MIKLSDEFFVSLRTHVNEGGLLTSRDAIDLIDEIERLRKLKIPDVNDQFECDNCVNVATRSEADNNDWRCLKCGYVLKRTTK